MPGAAGWAVLALSAALLLVLVHVPGWAALRLLGADRLTSLAAAPALAASAAGLGAIAAQKAGVPWSLAVFLALCAALIIAAGLLGVLLRRGAGTPGGAPSVRAGGSASAESNECPAGWRVRDLLGGVPWAPLWLLGAMAVQVAPILAAFGRPDGILERWDALYHLSALARIRGTGDGSSLTLGSLSNTQGIASLYPAAFHDLAVLVPGAPLPIVLNAAGLAFAVVPWALGLAVLARAIWPDVRWGSFAAALLGLLVPAAPVDEWIHLSPLPNLTGMAFLPGVLAFALVRWRELIGLPKGSGIGRCASTWLLLLIPLGAMLAGLGLLQPNSAVMALILIAVMCAGTAWRVLPSRPMLLLLPLACLLPVAVLQWTPLGSRVQSFEGGLAVSFPTALGEVGLGLLTVWPMALGVVIAAAWWPGLVLSFARGPRWLGAAWVIVAVLYLDAAVDSPLDLSVLFYRGQDRLAMPLAMLSVLLAVPGLRFWSRALGERDSDRTRPIVAAVIAAAAVVALASVPTRFENASKNAAIDYPGRPRFLQADEVEGFARVAPTMDKKGVVLASPFSGAAHLYGMYGQSVRFPVAGMGLRKNDRALLATATTATDDPAWCWRLEKANVKYIYLEDRPYANQAEFASFGTDHTVPGRVLFTTDHSRMIEVDCQGR